VECLVQEVHDYYIIQSAVTQGACADSNSNSLHICIPIKNRFTAGLVGLGRIE
jgi:hypothetical protein